MFYLFLATEGGNPTWEENFIEKNTEMQGIFHSLPIKLNQQKQRDVIQKVQ